MFQQHQHNIWSTDLRISYISRLFYKLSKVQFFCQLSHISCFCSSLSTNIIAIFVSFSSIIVDLWKVLINFNLLKLRSAVLSKAVIATLSLWWAQAPFPWASAEIFPGEAAPTFCLSVLGCWQFSANGRSQSTLLFYTKKKMVHFTAIITKNTLCWRQ